MTSVDAPVIFVSGGSRGIGRSIVLLAAERGYRVAFSFVSDADAANTVVDLSRALGSPAMAIRADVGVQDEACGAIAQTADHFGRLDGLVNNAGVIGAPRSILDTDEALLARVFAINVFGAFYCTAEAVRRMSTQHGANGGAIVNMSSASARHGGLPLEAHYAASKGALDSLTVSLAKELPAHGIRVNSIRPGIIATAIHDVHGGESTIRSAQSIVPLGRAGTSDEVAEVVMFLLGDRSSYIHGAIIDVSGGR
jgi:NAD(P)-dependent dehydrogenase (short-subunit alcohol dehydrogenase family)